MIFEFLNNELSSDEILTKLQTIIDTQNNLSNSQITNLKQLVKDIKIMKDMQDNEAILLPIIQDRILTDKAYIELWNSTNAKDAMEYITKNMIINVPNTNGDFLEKIIEEAIKSDNPEWVWRIAYVYGEEAKDITKIEDYIISKNNGYYINELISLHLNNLNMDKLIDAIINTQDAKEMATFVFIAYPLPKEKLMKIEKSISKIDGGWEVYRKYCLKFKTTK